MSTYLYALARWAFRHRRLVLATWLVVAVGAIALAIGSGGKTNDNFTIPGTEAQNASDLLSQKVPDLAGGQTQIVLARAGANLAAAPYKAAIETSVEQLEKIGQVTSVADPFTAQSVSANGHVALVIAQFGASAADVENANLDAMKTALAPATAAGLQVEYTGSVYPGWRTEISELPELVGIIVALIILLVTFGAFIAAGLPILNAVIGVVVTLMGVTAVASVVNVASASTTVALMLGLSCGIDYGLFILSRHRNNLMAGMAVEDSVALAVGTAGSSVVFAALTVIIALCGLSVVGIPFLTVMGLAAAVAVFVALLIALTLLPAMLGFAGGKITSFIRLPGRGRRTTTGHAERMAHVAANSPDKTFGARWARFVVRRRVPVLIGGVIVLAVLAIPTTRIQLGLPSGASKPTSDTSRKAYDLTTSGFGAGFNGALLVVADGVTTQPVAAAMSTRLAALPDVVSATPVALTNGVAVIRVIPESGPTDTATADLVHRVRSDRAAIEGTSGARILVGGTAASNIDVSAKLGDALPIFLVVVVGLAFVLLTFAFRTIFVPIKSILGFLLSVAAAFGSQVAIFQWGWGKSLFSITPTETVSFLPIIMLAIIFGLSSDYEVFVVSRIKEDFTKTGDARGAVVRGTSLSARVVTAAALIMFSIFVAFMITKDPTIKAIGFSFAVGVFLDAFVVRLTLVPAVMAIVGARIWYHPEWFARFVPDPDIEGERLTHRLAEARASVDPPTPALSGASD